MVGIMGGTNYNSCGYTNTVQYSYYPTDQKKQVEPKKEPELNIPLFAAGMALGFPIINYD